MHIVQVGPGVHDIPPKDYGAVERHIQHLANELRKLDHEVTILNEPLGSEYRWTLKALKQLKGLDADIVHTHTDFLGAWVAMRSQVPTVHTSHTPVWAVGAGNRPRAMWGEMWSRVAVKRSTRVIALTGVIREGMGMVRNPDAIHVVPNGVDTELYRPQLDARSGDRVGVLGKVVPHKNIHLIAEAMQGLPAELHVIGIQPDGHYVERIRDLLPEVRFHAGLSDEDLAELLGSMDIYAHASRAEALSLAVLEAMACGLPIVGSPLCRDQVVGNGVIIPRYEPGPWRQAIEERLDDPDLCALEGERSRKLAMERFSWPAVAEAVERVYMDALGADAMATATEGQG